MELWRECAQWLGRCQAIAPNDPVLAPSAGVKDLVGLLRDGVVLCRLAHLLDPDSLDPDRVLTESPDKETGRSVSDFLCRHNIFLFLHAIISNFQLSMDEHFFQPEELYQCKNVGKVLETLSALSHCARAQKSGVSGFPKKEKHLAKKLKREQKIYESLNEVYGEAETEYIYDSFSRSAKNLEEDHYEDIYQTIFPPKQPRLSLDISFGKKSRRAAPMHELMETEDTYLENLIMVRDVFRDNMTNMSPMHKRIVFFQLDALIELHSDILFGFKQKKVDVGRVFLNHMEIMSNIYGNYCVNLPSAMETLETLQAGNIALRKQVFDCQLKATPPTFPLSSHLVIPFQRFLKYHLLLKEILKQTPPEYSDHLNISRACEEMLKIGLEVNERKREHEENEKQIQADEADVRLIENVRQSIKLMQLPGDSRLTDFGRLKKAGDVIVYNETGKIADYVFLFDMIIVLCHKPKWLQHRYRFRDAIRVKDFFLEPVAPPEQAPNQDLFSVRLFKRADARKPPVAFLLKTVPERDSWFHSILGAMDTVNPSENANQGHVLQMTTFTEATECFQCHKGIKGNFFQGYRCLRCQVSLHKICIGDCPCIEVAGVRKAESLTLPTAMPDSLERSNSTLSLLPHDQRNGSRVSQEVQQMQKTIQDEMENIPVEDQPWYAGQLAGKVASERLESLPNGTFLIRQRANGDFALMLKTPERPKGVKAMVINRRDDGESGEEKFFFSGAREFDSIQKLVTFYRNKDLTENFDYAALKGICLKMPYKNL